MDVRIARGTTSAAVQLAGCMVTTEFGVDGGTVSPLYEAPWHDDNGNDPLLANLKGDFLCVPFGIAPDSMARYPGGWRQLSAGSTPYGHGYAANNGWEAEWARDDAARFRLDYPADDPVEWVAREVTCTETAVEIRDELALRRNARLPLGLHPMLRLPETAGAATLEPPSCEGRTTLPVPTDASSILQVDARFADLSATPLKDGGTIDLTRLPLAAATEELVFLFNVTRPSASLVNHAESYRVTLEWETSLLKHCLLWISNRGRTFSPWDGRNLCLGVEPITSAFDLGTDVSAAPNPLSALGIATAVDLAAGEVHSITHWLSVTAPCCVEGKPIPDSRHDGAHDPHPASGGIPSNTVPDSTE